MKTEIEPAFIRQKYALLLCDATTHLISRSSDRAEAMSGFEKGWQMCFLCVKQIRTESQNNGVFVCADTEWEKKSYKSEFTYAVIMILHSITVDPHLYSQAYAGNPLVTIHVGFWSSSCCWVSVWGVDDQVSVTFYLCWQYEDDPCVKKVRCLHIFLTSGAAIHIDLVSFPLTADLENACLKKDVKLFFQNFFFYICILLTGSVRSV